MSLLHDLSTQFLTHMADASIRALCLGLIALIVLEVVRMRQASILHAAWTTVLVAMLALPIVSPLLPPVPLHISLGAQRPVPGTPRVHLRQPIVINIAQGTVSDPGATRAPAPPLWPAFVSALYLAVALGFFARVLLGVRFSNRLLEMSAVVRDEDTRRLLEETAVAQSLPYPLPQLRESRQIVVPFTAGRGEPAILLPAGWRDWDAWKLRAVLAHELTHVRRGDWFVTLLVSLNKCVFWFHPLAWWLERRLATLAEQASDEACVLVTGDAQRYATVLLDVALAIRPGSRRLVMQGVSMARSLKVSRRIDRILSLSSATSGVLAKAGWAAILVCAVPLIYGVAAAQISNPPQAALEQPPTWYADGLKITAAEAQQLEQQIAAHPEDLAARRKVMAYYLYNAMPQALAPHIFWLIEHHPESSWTTSAPRALLPGTPGLNSPGDTERARALWLQQVTIHSQDSRVLGNAAQFLGPTDPFTAEDLLNRARQLDPTNPVWTNRLVDLYASSLINDSLVRPMSPGPADPAFVSKVRSLLDTSSDVALIGGVGARLATFSTHTHFSSSDKNVETMFTEALRAKAQYAEVLLTRAQRFDAGNPQWAAGLEEVRLGRERGINASLPAMRAAGPPSPQLIQGPLPVYPPLAKQARIQGVVRFKVTIGTDGHVTDIFLINGHPLLVPAAQQAVRQWIYQPQPTEVVTQVDVPFTLDSGIR